jgi:predicted metalloendopeptidase
MSAKKRIIKNKTKKRNPDDRCGDFFNAHDTFEDKIEAVFKKNNVDFLSTNYSLEKQLLKAHKQAVSPSNINPRRDFYTYINERWIKDYSVDANQKYIVQVDDFRLVQDKVYKELLEITDDYVKNNNTAASKCINRFYDSMKRFNTHEQSRAHASATLKQIDAYRADKKNLWKMLAYVNSNEIVSWGSPFSWTLNPDDKEPTIYRCYLDAPQVSLIDINVYFDDGLEVEYKRKYKATSCIHCDRC